MSDKRRKTKTQQMLLAFTAEGRDESPDDRSEGIASRAADSAIESPTSSDRLMERDLRSDDLQRRDRESDR